MTIHSSTRAFAFPAGAYASSSSESKVSHRTCARRPTKYNATASQKVLGSTVQNGGIAICLRVEFP
eukprot:6037749-Amphidinium_carterae.1